MYVSTHDGLPDAVNIAELWERASIVKKNFVKGQGQRRCPSFTGSGNIHSSQWSSNPFSTLHTPADCVRAIYQDRRLLRQLGGYLGTMDPDELAEAVVKAAASQQHENGSGSQHHDWDDEHHDRDAERQNWEEQFGPS